MSVLAPSLPGQAASGARRALPALGWAALAGLIGLMEAVGAAVDWKIGLVVAVAVVAAATVASRPQRLLPLAIVTIYLEDLTFGGSAVTRLLAPAALLVTVIALLRGTGRLPLGAPLAWVGAYVVWSLASGFWSVAVDGTRFMLQSLAIALVFLFAFASLTKSEANLRRLLGTLAFMAALTGGLSVIAFRAGPSFEIPHLELLQAGRSQGVVGDPDFFAAMQIVAVPLVLVLAAHTESRWMRVALRLALVPILASIFTSLSRGAFLAVALLGILLVVSKPTRIFHSRREKGIALLVVALGMVAFFSRPYAREQVVGRAETIYAPQTKDEKTGSGRTNLWKAAGKTARENPVFGIGYGTFIFVSQDILLSTPGVDTEVLQLRTEGENFVAHNTYLGTAAELGIVGLLLYLGVGLATALHLRRTARRAFAAGADFVGRVAYALVIGLATWSVTSIFLSAETARMFWIIVGLSLALPRLIPHSEPDGAARRQSSYAARSYAPASLPAPLGRR